MANKSLTDLTALTTTADSDLIHVNSGGTDYKEQKIDFMQGALYHKFDTSSLLTSQIDALPLEKTFFGMINSYGHTSETGLPLNASFFVTVYSTDNSGYRYAEITSVGGVVYTNTKNGTSWGGWTAVPTRAEITSLNNSLTKSYGDMTKASNITNLEGWYAKDGQVCSFYASATAGAVFAGGTDVLLSGLPIPKYGRIQGSGLVTSGGSFSKSLRVCVNSSGQLTLWYGGNLPSGDVITVQMCYVIA